MWISLERTFPLVPPSDSEVTPGGGDSRPCPGSGVMDLPDRPLKESWRVEFAQYQYGTHPSRKSDVSPNEEGSGSVWRLGSGWGGNA